MLSESYDAMKPAEQDRTVDLEQARQMLMRQKNVRLGWILATIVLVFFAGFIGRIVLLGG